MFSLKPALKRLAIVGVAAGLALSAAVPAFASRAMTGNGGPSGAHYNLNLIGVSNTMTGNGYNGNTILVPLKGHCTIDLAPTTSFDVVDGNCTDGQSLFDMPTDVSTTYQVYARTLGTPGGNGTLSSCFSDSTGTYCSIDQGVYVTLKNTGGKQSFQNVSKELLQVTTSTGTVDLFSEAGADYWWSYDNNGNKLVQLRFYPVTTQ